MARQSFHNDFFRRKIKLKFRCLFLETTYTLKNALQTKGLKRYPNAVAHVFD